MDISHSGVVGCSLSASLDDMADSVVTISSVSSSITTGLAATISVNDLPEIGDTH